MVLIEWSLLHHAKDNSAGESNAPVIRRSHRILNVSVVLLWAYPRSSWLNKKRCLGTSHYTNQYSTCMQQSLAFLPKQL